jgi:hypothetical protein
MRVRRAPNESLLRLPSNSKRVAPALLKKRRPQGRRFSIGAAVPGSGAADRSLRRLRSASAALLSRCGCPPNFSIVYIRDCRRGSLQIAKEKLRRLESSLAQGDALALPTRTPVAEIVAAYVRQIRLTKRPKRAQTDIDYLREAFGPICEELRVTSRRVTGTRRTAPKRTPTGTRREHVIAVTYPAIATGRDTSRNPTVSVERLGQRRGVRVSTRCGEGDCASETELGLWLRASSHVRTIPPHLCAVPQPANGPAAGHPQRSAEDPRRASKSNLGTTHPRARSTMNASRQCPSARCRPEHSPIRGSLGCCFRSSLPLPRPCSRDSESRHYRR